MVHSVRIRVLLRWAYQISVAHKVEVPSTPVVSQLVVSLVMVAQLTTSVAKQKILGELLRLTSPRFSGASREDT